MKRTLVSELTTAVTTRKGMDASHAWFERWEDRIELLERLLPSGSGFDSGTKIDVDATHADKLVLHTSYHHMNDAGYYDGWTDHTITVTPSFRGINIRVSGRNRNDIKDYIHETFHFTLTEDVTYELMREQFPELAVTSEWENQDGSSSQCYRAWYSSGVRFWNDFAGAKTHAATLMEQAFYGRNK